MMIAEYSRSKMSNLCAFFRTIAEDCRITKYC